MNNGFVKLSLDVYDALMIGNNQKSRQLAKQAEKIADLTEELEEKKEYLDKLARTTKHTVDFLEHVNPKLVKEWREYIKLVEESENE